MRKAFVLSCLIAVLVLCFSFSANTYKNFNSHGKTQHFLKSDPETENKDYLGSFTVTGYDLSYQSCEKLPDHPAYGITSSGKSLKNHTRESAMAVAVDPNYIPLGSKILLVFSGDKKRYTGIYKAVDTGGAIKGRRIDLFFGDTGNSVSAEAIRFGRTSVDVYLLN